MKQLLLLALTATLAAAQTVGTAFTYQGHLMEDSQPANGVYDFRAELIAFDMSVQRTDVLSDVAVTDGLFTLEIDFGDDAFTGQIQSLRIMVKADADAVFTTLSDQPLNLAPKAEWSRRSNTNLQNAADNGPNEIVTDNEGLLLRPDPPTSRTFTLQVEGQESILADGRAIFNGRLTANDGLSSTDLLINDGLISFNHQAGFEPPTTIEPYYVNNIVRGFDFNIPTGDRIIRLSDQSIQAINTSGIGEEILFTFQLGSIFGGELNMQEVDVEVLRSGELYVNGIKNFIMDHPTDATKSITYAAVEGPEAGAYCRGTALLVDGQARIEFDEHFSLVMNPATMTVQVTPRSADSLGLAVVEQDATGFTVRELHKGTGSYEFSWHATAVRQGYEDYQPVRPRDDF